MLRHGLALTLLLATACTPKPADTDSDSADGSSGPAATSDDDATLGAEASGGGTTTAPPDPTTGGTTGEPPDPSADASSDPTVGTSASSGDPTTGGGGVDEACLAACEHFFACAPDQSPPPAACAEACVADANSPECAAAIATLWSCVAALPCDEALKFLDGEPTMCLQEADDADTICLGDECSIGGGGDMNGTFCMVEKACGDLDQKFECMGDTCQCFENGAPGPTCPAGDVCKNVDDFDAMLMAAEACCGWEP